MRTSLMNQIESKRLELISTAFSKGFTDVTTVELSEELDELLNMFSTESKKTDVYLQNKRISKVV